MICTMTPGQKLTVCHLARWPICRLHSEKLSLASENPGPTRSAHQLFAASRKGSLGPCQRDGFRRPSQHSPGSTSVDPPHLVMLDVYLRSIEPLIAIVLDTGMRQRPPCPP